MRRLWLLFAQSVTVLVAVWFRYVFQAVAVTAFMLPVRGSRP